MKKLYVVVAILLAFVSMGAIAPAFGLYWMLGSDPTAAGGLSAPLNQLLIRTDVPAIYYKATAVDTGWVRLGLGTGGAGIAANAVIKSDGTNTVASSITDDAVNVSTAEPVQTNLSLTVNNGQNNLGTTGLIFRGGTSAQDSTLAQRQSQTWPVVVGRPNTAATCMTYDIMPNGAPASCGPGVAWMDVCNADLIGNPAVATQCARYAIGAGAIVDSVALNGAAQLSTLLEVGGNIVVTVASNAVTIAQGVSINIASGTAFAVTENQNNGTFATVTNTTSGTASFTKFGLSNGTNVGELYHFSAGYTTNGALQANSTALYSTGTNGINIAAGVSTGDVRLYAGGIAAGNLAFEISRVGHELVNGTAPGLSACGTGPAFAANSPATDQAGRVATGTTNTGCVITFANTYTKIPSCTWGCETTLAVCSCVPSATALTCTLTANSSDVIDYICNGPTSGT